MSKRQRNFVILFNEKEGTSALVNLLDNFPRITIIRKTGLDPSIEPFDLHACGRISRGDLRYCLNSVLGSHAVDIDRVNKIYFKASKGYLKGMGNQGSTGFKTRMRNVQLPFYPHGLPLLSRIVSKLFPGLSRRLERLSLRYTNWSYRRMVTKVLKNNNVVVFMAVRQDLLRWGLSKYHGDGKGNPGHLQFKLNKGEIRRDDLGKIHVDSARFRNIIAKCKRIHAEKRQTVQFLKRAGIEVYPICYEDLLGSKHELLARMCSLIGYDVSDADIQKAIDAGGVYEKVHSDDISEFVENHQEISLKFSNEFIPWR